MITYELAKRLKDAGFSQVGSSGIYPEGNREHNPKNLCYVPTLEELIEAVGDEFGGLIQFHKDNGTSDKWIAHNYTTLIGYIEIEGETPSEAVANLWLALNEKK